MRENGWIPSGQTAAMGGKLLLSVKEAAALLSISVRQIQKLTNAGMIACRRIGRRVLYTRQALEAYALQPIEVDHGQHRH